jgi:hypothetical protein
MQLPGELSGVCIEELTDRHVLGVSPRSIDLVHIATESSHLLAKVQAFIRLHRYATPDLAYSEVQSLEHDISEFIRDTWKKQHHPAEFAGLDVALRYRLFLNRTEIPQVPANFKLPVLRSNSSAGSCKAHGSLMTGATQSPYLTLNRQRLSSQLSIVY